MMELAPIILFAYNRPWHVTQTLEALAANHLADQSTLYIFADGPKADASVEDLEKINETRVAIRDKQWCKEVIIREADTNFGLAESVIAGVTEIVNKHGKVVVLEDDIITSPYFLTFLNDGLKVYQDSGNVYAINSYMFPIDTDEVTTFLSPLGTSTWGWATWADKWKAFERTPKHKTLIQTNPFLRSRFNLADYNYADMLDNTNSWGIRWYYSVFVRNGLGLFPTKTLCKNIGFGEGATHTKGEFPQMDIQINEIHVVFSYEIGFTQHSALLSIFDRQISNDTLKNHFFRRVLKKVKSIF